MACGSRSLKLNSWLSRVASTQAFFGQAQPRVNGTNKQRRHDVAHRLMMWHIIAGTDGRRLPTADATIRPHPNPFTSALRAFTLLLLLLLLQKHEGHTMQ